MDMLAEHSIPHGHVIVKNIYKNILKNAKKTKNRISFKKK